MKTEWCNLQQNKQVWHNHLMKAMAKKRAVLLLLLMMKIKG
jgi:hypothetical protein